MAFGWGVMLLAVMVTVFPPLVVIPVHGVVQAGSNFFRMGLMRHFIDRSIIVPFAVGSLLAALLGTQVVVALEPFYLQLLLGLFILYLVWGPKLSKVYMSHKIQFYLGGFLTTLASLFVGASGPLAAAFIGRVGLKKEAQVATHATAMVVQHGLKTLVFGFVGFAFADYALLMGLMATGFAGTYVGKHVLLKLPEKIFRVAYKVVITLLALRLLYMAFLSY